jgi:hypothetical protein
MEKVFLTKSIFAGLCLTAASAIAQPTVISECPKKHLLTLVNVTASVSTSVGCPLLTDKSLRKLVDKNFFGTAFAYPAVPGTCLSGVDLEGWVGSEEVTGTTESAQRFFPEAGAVNPGNGSLFLAGNSFKLPYMEPEYPFLSGAAATVVSLQGESVDLRLVLSDRFTVNLATGQDTEDFEVVGADGVSVTGRLRGEALITAAPGEPFEDVPFKVSGTICIGQ